MKTSLLLAFFVFIGVSTWSVINNAWVPGIYWLVYGLFFGQQHQILADQAKKNAVERQRYEALKPFAEAFEKYGKWHYTDHEDMKEWFRFHDSNQVIPARDLTMGDFRRAYEAFKSESEEKKI